jgi:hypothetical protein
MVADRLRVRGCRLEVTPPAGDPLALRPISVVFGTRSKTPPLPCDQVVEDRDSRIPGGHLSHLPFLYPDSLFRTH